MNDSIAGEKMGKLFAVFPIFYLSGGNCVALIIVGGSSMKLFFEILCGHGCTAKPLTTVEWYLVFTCAAVVLSQMPNLNSIAGVSLIGAITAIGYSTIMWLVAVTEGRLDGVSYDPIREDNNTAMIFSFFNAIGIIAFAFRGHNLILEIQVINHPLSLPNMLLRFFNLKTFKSQSPNSHKLFFSFFLNKNINCVKAEKSRPYSFKKRKRKSRPYQRILIAQ